MTPANRGRGKKTQYTGGKKATKKREALRAMWTALLDLGNSFSEGTDKIVDVCLDDRSRGGNKDKARKIKEELARMLNEMGSGITRNMKDVTLKGVMCDTSYELGRGVKIAKNSGVEIVHNLKE